ncbi:MAG: hypothetical protein L0H29_01700 [Sinobacteraceae bacterium]|nr:hypothetical protein [Nevskiaceae bacterium]
MLGIWGTHSGLFLVLLGIVMLLAFGIPMALWPLRWARVLRWQLPTHTDLAVYFGRSLGSVATVIGVFSFVAAADTMVRPFYFGFLLACWVLMVLVHLYGAIRRIQPLSESCELPFWGGLVILTLLCWPVVPV